MPTDTAINVRAIPKSRRIAARTLTGLPHEQVAGHRDEKHRSQHQNADD